MRNSEPVVIALLVACAGCGGGIARAGRVTAAHDLDASPVVVCSDLMRAASARGYEVIVAQEARARFAVRAAFADRFGQHTLSAQCLPDGAVAIRAHGPRVERAGGASRMPVPLHTELMDFRDQMRLELTRLEEGGPRREGPVAWATDLPEQVAGVRPDNGLVVSGGISLAASYLVGSLTSLALTIECGYPDNCDERAAIVSFIPLAHWSTFAGSWSIATGAVFSALELVSIIVLFAGAAHHRAGPVALSGPGTLTIAF